MNVMKTKIAGIVTAVVLAGVGTLLLIVYVKGAESRALKGEKPASVLVWSEAEARERGAATVFCFK